MDSVNYVNIEPAAAENGHRVQGNWIDLKYNFQHLVFVTKYRYKMFRNPKTIAAIKSAFYDAANRHDLTIKELSFGEDFAHVHLEVSVPINMAVSKAAQLLKGYSSYMVFKEIPNHRLRYPQGHFWGEDFSCGSVGPRSEATLQNYIRRQDISGQQTKLAS